MALNSTGPISLGGATTGQSINLELGLSATATISLNDTTVRSLLGVSSGAISLNSAYGKSHNVPITVTANFNSVAFNGSTFVAVGDGGIIFKSTDKGVTWFQQSSGGYTNNLKNIVYFGNKWVAAGDNGFILYSADGVTWNYNSNFNGSPLITYNLDILAGVVVVSGESSGSPVFRTFSNPAGSYLPTSNTSFLSAGLVGQVFDNYASYHTATKSGLFYYRTQPPTDTSVLSSGWNNQGRDATATLYPLNSIAVSNSYLFGVGEHPNSIRGGSINGSTFPFSYSGASVIMRKIRYLNSQFVAVGDSGTLLYWPDGFPSSTITTRNSISSQNINDINGSTTAGYVAVGSGGTLLYNTSSYTSTWSAGATYTNT